MRRGIDVSSYQGKIDWTRVKPYIDFAILRCGWGNDIKGQDDVYFERNTEMCKELTIPFGVYLSSYATTLDEARSEVNHTLRLIRNKHLEYPVFLAIESKRQMALSKDRLIEIVKYYCEEMQKAGYYVGIYSSLDHFKSNLDSQELDSFDKWIAEWNEKFTYKGRAGIWQNTSYEEVPGIRDRVDGDIALLDYPKVIRELGLNHLEERLKYRVGDKVYISGDVYEHDNGEVILKRICDVEVVIEEVNPDAIVPYRIHDGYVKEISLYTKYS